MLLSFAGEVKITDFGISRAGFQAKSQHEVIRGKYAYMSPEQVGGKPLDGRTDLFSTSIALFELVTGRRLFKARTREETLARVRRAEVPSPKGYRPEISDDLERLLLKALSKRPEDRFQTAGEMHEAMTTIMVREGYRVTNTDLANYMMQVIEAVQTQRGEKTQSVWPRDAPKRSGRAVRQGLRSSALCGRSPEDHVHPESAVGGNYPRSLEGEIWERADGSVLPSVPLGGQRGAQGRHLACRGSVLCAPRRHGRGGVPPLCGNRPRRGSVDGQHSASNSGLGACGALLSGSLADESLGMAWAALLTEVASRQTEYTTQLLQDGSPFKEIASSISMS